MIFDADGYYVSRDSSLTIYQKNQLESEEITSMEQLFQPIITQSIATFPRGEWKGIYVQEGVESEQ